MIVANIDISDVERDRLKNVIGKRMLRINSEHELPFPARECVDFIQSFYIDCGEIYLEITIREIVADYFDGREDGFFFNILRARRNPEHWNYIKPIDRIVRGVSIVTDTVDFQFLNTNSQTLKRSFFILTIAI